jgi:predicted metal-dependent phosphoesterase TrpH
LSPIDLHCHSSWSDGGLTPRELIARAARRGVRVLALTDHDTVEGIAEAQLAARQHGLLLVAGVEISVTWSGRTLHVVGLGVDPDNPELDRGLIEVRAGRGRRAAAIADRLARLGIPGVLAGASALASNQAMLGRTHIARHLVAIGAVKDTKAAFRRYLGEGKPGYVKHRWASLPDAISWIRSAGGVAVLAHPGRYDLSAARLVALLHEFRELGGAGVEVVTASHAPEQVQRIASLAQACSLEASAGSDFHSPEDSWMDLGGLPELPQACRPIWRDWPLGDRALVA